MSRSYIKEIDNEILIEEVRIRPALYDKNVREYNDHALKKKLWEEVTKNVYSESWGEMDEAEKEARGMDVLKRWNNLRSCFTRGVKQLKDPLTNSKKRKYVYNDLLIFLLDTNTSNTGQDTAADTEDVQSSDNYVHIPKRPKRTTFAESKAKQVKKLKEFVETSIEKIKEVANTSTNTEKNINTDSDINFALSLVPLLKMIPVENKIDAEIDILSVIRRYTKKIEVQVKNEKESSDHASGDDSSIIYDLF